MTVRDYMDILDKVAPAELAFPWDHVGLMVGNPSQEVTAVVLCVDLTRQALEMAGLLGANLIITHHPVIFDPIQTLDESIGSNKRLAEAIRRNMTVISYHTNLDLAPAPYGINYNLVVSLGLKNITLAEDGFHYYGDLPTSISAQDFLVHINEALDTECRALYNKGPETSIQRVGVSCGAFDDEVEWLSQYGCDALVIGEAKHSGFVDLSFEDFTVYAAGHYATELPGVKKLQDILPGKVYVCPHGAGDGALCQ